MKYGFFDDKNKEYVITRPDTPLPWINYLGTENFFGIISNTSGGYCFYMDARKRRLTRYRYNNIPMDSNGRYIYVKDGDTVWNPMWKPMLVKPDNYECRHGLGYTKITGQKNELEVSTLFFIPLNSRHEVWNVHITNFSKEIKKVRLWGFVEWCLWEAYDDMTNYQRNYSIGQVEVGENVIFHKTEYRERRNHYAYFAVDKKTSGFDTSRDAFVGVHYGLNDPQAIKNGGCKNSTAYGWLPVGVHQIDLKIKPGNSVNINFLLGYAENTPGNKFNQDGTINKDEFFKVFEKYSANDVVQKEFNNHKKYWDELLSTYQVNTPDPIVNRVVNIWNQYQCMVTFNMSRSASLYETGIGRGMGYRDSNQDLLGFVHMIPSRARQRILDISSTQLSDGMCYHQYQPLTKKGNADIGGGFNDDPLWLILSTSSYIKETGDYSILYEVTGFADLENSGSTLLDHLYISIKYTLDHLGPHGLPLIGHADWNDCLNLNCFSNTPGESFQLAGHIENDNIAESVMIAGLFCKACDEMADLLKHTGKNEQAKVYNMHAEKMRKTILEHAWDGEWFLRAYDSYGNKVGSSENDEGKIFIESQGWCIIGGVGLPNQNETSDGENGYAQKALDSIKKYLSTSNGIILQQPAYSKYYIHLGEVSSYPPGYKENAGIFTHNNTWIQIAETLLGRGDRAMEYYKSICPPVKEEQIDIYRAEPYVYSQMTAGRDAQTPGEGKNSWLTGTGAWSFVAVSQYILGIRPYFDGLIVDPCIPHDWKNITVIRKFRKSVYKISINNPSSVCKGVKKLILDDKLIKGSKVPDISDGKIHNVVVELG